ncbi:MAG: hypothetical protein MZV70_52190 [Desulfobacterales bacterium]|nr:hypothetical protein [Desulfobacterales bacterium]
MTDGEGEEPYLRQIRGQPGRDQRHSAAESRRIRSPCGRKLKRYWRRMPRARRYMQAVDQPMPQDFDPLRRHAGGYRA